MQTYQPPIDDIRFLLETFDYAGHVAALDKFSDFDLTTAMSLVEEYARYCTEVLAPLNRTGDEAGVKYDPDAHTVTLPEGFKAAYQGFCENGFTSLPYTTDHGGMGAPFCLSTLGGEILIAANKSFSMCTGLTGGLIEALQDHGSPEQQEALLPKLISGTWAGTMCLTEPQCGTDLGLLTTRAVPHGDHYALTGTKIWITFGEQDHHRQHHPPGARAPARRPGRHQAASRPSWCRRSTTTASATPCSAAAPTTRWASTPPPPA